MQNMVMADKSKQNKEIIPHTIAFTEFCMHFKYSSDNVAANAEIMITVLGIIRIIDNFYWIIIKIIIIR